MRRIQSVMAEAIGRDEVLRAARAQKVLRQWPEVVGPVLGSKSAPDRYEKGTVWVVVEGSAWASELRLNKDRILARLRDLAGDPTLFEKLRFGVRKLSEAKLTPKEEPEQLYIDRERHDLDGLSIREIAERRIAKLRDENRD